jgi:hypothetical protein
MVTVSPFDDSFGLRLLTSLCENLSTELGMSFRTPAMMKTIAAGDRRLYPKARPVSASPYRSSSPRGHSEPVPRFATGVFRASARVGKRMPFGAATVRERTQRPIFRQNARHFTEFSDPSEQCLIVTHAIAGVFTRTLTRTVLCRSFHADSDTPDSLRCAPIQYPGSLTDPS